MCIPGARSAVAAFSIRLQALRSLLVRRGRFGKLVPDEKRVVCLRIRLSFASA